MSAFTDMMNRLKRKEGYSTDVARKVAAKIGRESIGQKEMTRRSVESRKEHEQHQHARRSEPFRALMGRLRK